MTPQETPPWGTPEGPEYGTPPPASPPAPAPPAPTRPSPDPAAAGWGSPAGPLDLLSADTIVVVEQGGFLTAGGYDLVTPGGEPLGSLLQETSVAGLFFGGAASTTYRLLDPQGLLIASMLRPGTIGRSQFMVTDSDENDVGWVEQEFSFTAPELLITAVDGAGFRLFSPGLFGSDWELVDAADESVQYGLISQEFAGLSGMLGDTQRFAVQLSPALPGAHRLLAVMATVCLDYIRDAKDRR